MSNHVPPAEHRARFRDLSDRGSKAWRDGCLDLCRRHPHYQTVIKGNVASGQPNYAHLLAAAKKCGHAYVTDANVAQVLTDIEKRAAELYPAQPKQAALI